MKSKFIGPLGETSSKAAASLSPTEQNKEAQNFNFHTKKKGRREAEGIQGFAGITRTIPSSVDARKRVFPIDSPFTPLGALDQWQRRARASLRLIANESRERSLGGMGDSALRRTN